MSQIYFAWSGPNDAWSATMLREDELIFAILIRHTESDFPTLQIDVKNPRVGLLAAGRDLWCWLSYAPDPLSLPIPIFRGRLIGIPENLQDEVVRLEFVSRPQDYQAQKVTVAQTLQVAPYWDPVWLQQRIDDPDTVLESRPELWHIDRVTLGVSASDILEGEDGIVDVTADDHFYDAMTVSYGQTPLRRVNMTGTVTWSQTAAGTVDLTPQLIAAFQAAGSPLPSPLICSLTGDGLVNSWPSPGASVGGGWAVGADSSIQLADWIRPAYYKKVYVTQDPFQEPTPLPAVPSVLTSPPPKGGYPGATWVTPTIWEYPTNLSLFVIIPPFRTFAVAFPVVSATVKFTADYSASRNRSETVTFALDADVQSIITDPGQDEDATVDLSSDAILQPIDPGGATPLNDPRSPTYFKTTRGAQSFEYLLMLARAKLLARARCVLIKFATTWDFVIGWISCRYSIRLFDPRLPGGVAIGKITGYQLSFSTDGIAAEVTIGCTVGHGGAVAVSPGAPSYASPGYVARGYLSLSGATVSAVPGSVAYLSFDDYLITDDDGVDFFNMTAGNVLNATPAVNLTTTANLTLGNPKLTTLASTTGLLPGNSYSISGPAIPAGATFVYDGSAAGTLSIAPALSVTGTAVTISGPANNGFTVTNGPAVQANVVDLAAAVAMMPNPPGALKAAPTRVCLDLVSCTGGAFHVDYPMVVQPMIVPKTIDLEAP